MNPWHTGYTLAQQSETHKRNQHALEAKINTPTCEHSQAEWYI